MTGEEIKNIRLNYGMTQRELAKILGCSVGHICAIELGRNKASSKLVQKIRKYDADNLFRSDISKLLDEEFINLKLVREYLAKNQADFAALAKCLQSDISRIENGFLVSMAKYKKVLQAIKTLKLKHSGKLNPKGNKIRKIRDERGWSQEEMASALGTTQHTISAWERGLFKPSESNYAKIMKLERG